MKKYILATIFAASLMCGCQNVGDTTAVNGTVQSPQGTITEMPKLSETKAAYASEMSEASSELAEAAGETEQAVPAGGDTETPVTERSAKTTEEAGELVPVESIFLSLNEIWLEVGKSKMPIVTMYPENATDKSEIWTISDDTVATVDELGNVTGIAEGSCMVTVTSRQNPDVFATIPVTVVAVPDTMEEDGATYIDGILVVNKTYALPSDYGNGIDPEAQEAFDKMQADAAEEGLDIYIASGFRSYDYQAGLYQRYVDKDGKEEADRYSARPGHSEHQTGLAFDLNTIDDSFADTAEGKWVRRNCHKYGFIIRYPSDKEDVTGYKYEPWHIRYLGEETAQAVYDSGLCLEEYLGITSEYAE